MHDKQNRTQISEINSYGQLIFHKGDKNNVERIISIASGTGTTGFPHVIELSWTPTSCHLQKLTQNGSMT